MGVLPVGVDVKADDDRSVNTNVDLGSHEVPATPMAVPDASQPEAVQVDITPHSELPPHDGASTLSLPDPFVAALDDTTLSAAEVHAQLVTPASSFDFSFVPMHVDAPVRSTSMQPTFGHAASDDAPAAAGPDPSLRYSIPPSTPTPPMASEWSYNFVDNTTGYNGMAADMYINPMSQYAGGQPAYRTYSNIATF
jgi:hypothetical protein